MPDPMRSYLDFEKPVAELDAKIDELRALAATGSDIGDEIARIEDKAAQALTDLYANLTPWQKTLVARHPQRPHFTDFVNGADHRIHAAGRRPQIRRRRSDGRRLWPVPRRKHLRHRPGKGRHHREPHQAQFRHGAARRLSQGGAADGDGRPLRHSRAVDRRFRPAPIPASAPRSADRPRRSRARPMPACRSACPMSRSITGEGMSGGAIAITTANRVLMLEHAIYSVISPEAASSILWRDGTKAQEAATSMKITAQDMLRFGVIDRILKEPAGGAHRDPAAMIAATGEAIAQAFDELRNLDAEAIRNQRRQKFLDIGRKLG